MKNWFYQERGATLGPITFEEMKARIRDGRLRLFDLVFRDGEPGWRMAMEHADLRAEFKTSAVQSLADRPWVCLQKKSADNLEFQTTGPFTSDEIRLALQEGRIAYGDYVWRDGYREWKRIGTVPEFNRRLQVREDEEATKIVPALPDIPSEDLLQNVVPMKRPQAPLPPVPPPEAEGEDLTERTVIEHMPVAPRPPPAVSSTSTSTSSHRTKTSTRRSRPPTVGRDWMIVGVLMLVFVGALGGAIYLLKKTGEPSAPVTFEPPPLPAPEPESEPVAPPVPQPSPPPPVEPVAAPEPPPKPVAKVSPPTLLQLSVQTVSSTQVKIDMRTDASPDFPVYVQIVGLPGQVAEGASFYKFMKLNPKGSSSEPLDLSGLNLPQGRFILRAETGSLKKEARMSVGTSESQFKQTVARLRKVYASAIWKERLELFALSELLEKQLTEALAGKKFTGRGLNALGEVKKTNGASYILFEQWYEMKEILVAARTAPNMALLGRLKQAREKLSTFSVWK